MNINQIKDIGTLKVAMAMCDPDCIPDYQKRITEIKKMGWTNATLVDFTDNSRRTSIELDWDRVVGFVKQVAGDDCYETYGKIPAKIQRELFGVFLGKGMVNINLIDREIAHSVSVSYGLDRETNKYIYIPNNP